MSLSLRECFDAVVDLPPGERFAWYQRQGLPAAITDEVEALIVGERAELVMPELPQLDALSDGEEQLGAYTVLEAIGSGGMGTVYRARRSDGRADTEVAIKRSEQVLDDQLRARLQLESAMLAKLSHPNIGRFIDAGADSLGRPYLIMELIDGEPLDQWLDQRRADLRQRVALCVDLLDALQHAHSRLVLHRDIKASNVLVDRSGTPKLIDFGIARPLDHAVQTRAYGRFLTLANAAPEQIRNEDLGTGVDVYGAGILLYQLLSGSHPYLSDELSLGELEKRILNGDPKAPSQVVLRRDPGDAQSRGQTTTTSWCKALRGDLDAIVLKSLRTDPAARYASCADFAEDLRAWLESRPVVARRGGLVYRMQRYARRHWLPLSVGSAVFLGSVGFSWTLYQRGIELEAARVLAESERAEAQRQQAEAEAISDFLTQLFVNSNPRSTGSAALTARELLGRGVDSLIADARMPSEQRVRLLQTVAEAFIGIDDTLAAVDAMERAKNLASSTPQARFDRVLEHRVLAARALQSNEPGRALDQIALALEMLERGVASNSNAVEVRLQKLTILANNGRWIESLDLASELVTELSAEPESPLFLEAIRAKAGALGGLGRSEEHLNMLSELESTLRQRISPNDPLLAEYLFTLAAAQSRLAIYDLAFANYREAGRIVTSAFGTSHPRAHDARAGVAAIENSRGNYSVAIAMLEDLIDEQLALGRDAQMSRNAMNLSIAYQQVGELQKAIKAIEIALSAAERIWPGGHHTRVVFGNQLGELLLRSGRDEAAVRAFSESLSQVAYLKTTGAVLSMPKLQSAAEVGLAEAQRRLSEGASRVVR